MIWRTCLFSCYSAFWQWERRHNWNLVWWSWLTSDNQILNLMIRSRWCICFAMPTNWRLRVSSPRRAGTATLIPRPTSGSTRTRTMTPGKTSPADSGRLIRRTEIPRNNWLTQWSDNACKSIRGIKGTGRHHVCQPFLIYQPTCWAISNCQLDQSS